MNALIGFFALSATVSFLVLIAIAFTKGAPAQAGKAAKSSARTAKPVFDNVHAATASQPEKSHASSQGPAPIANSESLALAAMHSAHESIDALWE